MITIPQNPRVLKEQLYKKYFDVIRKIRIDGAYIFGSGRLGQYAKNQLKKNGYIFKGYISNNGIDMPIEELSNPAEQVVIISSYHIKEISDQLDRIGVKNYAYYEELALVMDEFDTYYMAFDGIFEEVCKNSSNYLKVFDVLSDETSRRIYEYILKYRMTLDIKYTEMACELSNLHGELDFDGMILPKIKDNYSFLDCGGFDGSSSVEFINHTNSYNSIIVFEPVKENVVLAKQRLSKYHDIKYVQAGVGNVHGTVNFDPIIPGSGTISGEGKEKIDIVCLDDYIDSVEKSYVKMDIEGSESEAIMGGTELIKEKSPILSISLYHKPGDLPNLIFQILSINPNYKVILRHYSCTYGDTRGYFYVDK